jgi:tartrate-resistant acid phosphatase type 5
MAVPIMPRQPALFIWTLLLSLVLTGICRAQQPQDREINLLAMGDWGSGRDDQRLVADRLADYVQTSQKTFSGILLAGDNFYADLTGIDDPLWQTLFEQMYDPKRLAFPFYAALGNHDLENGKMQIELDYAKANPKSRWKLPARWYELDFPVDRPLVKVLMLDSNKQGMTEAEWNTQMDWMKAQFNARNAQWLICCAHHPLFSNGNHGDNGALQRDWGPLFESGKVDAFVCGHDHDLQHLEVPGRRTSFMLVGGGGQQVRPIRVDQRGPFSRSVFGFTHLMFTPQRMVARFIDVEGQSVHVFERSIEGNVRIIETTASDVATPRTVRSITRGGGEATTIPAATAPATRP